MVFSVYTSDQCGFTVVCVCVQFQYEWYDEDALVLGDKCCHSKLGSAAAVVLLCHSASVLC